MVDRIQSGPSDATGRSVKDSSFLKSPKAKTRRNDKDVLASKRRCVSTACMACRRRKSKCDGNTPSCAACSSVYGTECIYDPNSDHRRKGVYKKDIDNLRTRNSTLQTLIQGILNYPEHDAFDLVRQIRSCENLEDVAEEILAREAAYDEESDEPVDDSEATESTLGPTLERELSGKMGELRVEGGSVRFIGGTSNLLFLDPELGTPQGLVATTPENLFQRQEDILTSWTSVTKNAELIFHLLNMYFTWHYPYFTTLSKALFFRDFSKGKREHVSRMKKYCTPLLVNAMLALGCHFTSWPEARTNPEDSSTAGDQFFKEAKRLIVENDEFESPSLATVQALALMSVREAGCGREPKGWIYSGMSFRMACDLGLNIDSMSSQLDEQEIDARRITFWGCFLFDKCWSNYLGRPPQLPLSNITAPKFDVFPTEDAEPWSPWTDTGLDESHSQPSRTRAIALQISALCEISSDLLLNFYRPPQIERPLGKQAEVKKLSDFHTRLEAWRKSLPREMEPREGQLPNVLLMHMFFHLLFIHLFRPFLKYHQANSPLPSHVSPRKICSQAAAMISKLLRLYKRTYGLRQICNIAVYIAHSACTIHLLNLPHKDARRDIAHGVRQLEEIGESWLCARRTLATLAIQVRRWSIDLPNEPAAVLARAEARYNNLDPQPPGFGKTSPTIEKVKRATGNEAVNLVPPPVKSEIPNSVAQKPSPPVSVGSVNSFKALPEPVIDAMGTGTRRAQQQNQVREQTQVPDQNQQVQQYPEGWTRDTLQAPVQRPKSPSALFGSLDDLFEDSKDWWLRDQSVAYDHWSGLGGRARMNSGGGLPNIMNGMNGLNGLNGTNEMANNSTVSNNTSPINGTIPANSNSMMNMNGQVGNFSQVSSAETPRNGMGYLDFTNDTYNYDNNSNFY